ncbi:MAG TPA: hypothetical protein VGM50_06395 [Gemmatimonadaceae bacterium]|jgi:hypothetical protein
MCSAVTVAFAFFAIACGKAERHQPDSATTGAGAAGGAGGQPGAEALRGQTLPTAPQPGALAKPVDSYSGDELYDFTRRIAFVGGVERDRRCRGHADCRDRARNRFTRIRVDAVDQEDSLSSTSVSPNGAVVIRASNRGEFADSMYNMHPGPNYEYFLIVLPASQGTKAHWRLEELDLTSAAKRTHRTVSQGTVTECNHPFRRGARADFKSCATAATIRPASFSPMQGPINDEPIWFACAAGCCTADGPDGG